LDQSGLVPPSSKRSAGIMDIDDKLKQVEERYEKLQQEMTNPEVVGDHQRMSELAKEAAELEPIVTAYREYRSAKEQVEEAREILEHESDPEMKDLAEAELDTLKDRIASLESRIRELLLPKDPNDERDVIVEIRAGIGGEEAALFAADLYRMYTRYAESKGWKATVMSSNETGIGGFKEIIFEVKGRGAYSRPKYESGVHRVQRVPQTESQGRIHTSTATVAVLPKMEDVEVEIKPEDIRVDVFRATGPGGQSVNTTDSAVRITHLPTGIVVSCQDEKSQLKNRAKAMTILRSRLYALEEEKRRREVGERRLSQIGTGERSEKIRTYNFPQNRVTDHRIGKTVYRLQEVLDGDLDEFIDELAAREKAELLASEKEKAPA
jgi:peptide chain release factor 1